MKNDEKIYVGIDFSKGKFNACLRMGLGVMGEAEFPNTKGGYLKLVRWVKKTSGLGKAFSYDNVLFCGEHTGSYSMGLSEYLYGKGIKMWLENALMIKYGSGLQRQKDDRADAEMIAIYAERFYQEGKTPLFVPQSNDLKTLRSLYNFRRRVMRERVAMGNALKAQAFACSTLAQRKMTRRWEEDKRDEAEILREMRSLMESSPELSGNYRILTSFKGVGALTAALLLIHTANFTKMTDPRQFACFCGIAPFGKQSGTSINTKPHVSKFAHISVKAELTEAAKSAIRTNPVIRQYATRLWDKGKQDGVVINNVKNKIVHILFKLVETQTEWSEDYGQSHTTGNPSPRPVGESKQKGAAEAAPCADSTVQTSPSACGGDAKLQKPRKISNTAKKSFQKTCAGT